MVNYKFEFTLDEEERRTLFDILHEQVDRIIEDANNHVSDREEREWLLSYARQIQRMAIKMTPSCE